MTLGWFVDAIAPSYSYTQTETKMTYVERINEYANMEDKAEAPARIEPPPPPDW